MNTTLQSVSEKTNSPPCCFFLSFLLKFTVKIAKIQSRKGNQAHCFFADLGCFKHCPLRDLTSCLSPILLSFPFPSFDRQHRRFTGEKIGETKRTNSEEKMADKDDAIPPPTGFIYDKNIGKMVKPVKKEVEKMEVDELPQGLPEEGFAGHPVGSHECTEEVRVARKALETSPSLEAKSKNYDPNYVVLALPRQKSRKAVRPSRVTTIRQTEAMATRKVLETGSNSGDKGKDFDPNFVVLALTCQNSRKAAAPGRVAAEASFVRAKESSWCPPPPGVYKINFHGFSFSEFGDAGIGIVVRDFRGDLIAAMSRKVKYGSFPQSIEALAISLGLRFGHDLGLTRVFMEGDSAKLGSDLCSKTSYPLLNKESIEKYEFFKFAYVEEEANLVAHKLACYAVRLEDFIVWMEDPPDFIVNTLALDASPIKK